MARIKKFLPLWAILTFATCLLSCSSTGGVKGNEEGSSPVNQTEVAEYKRAVLKCYKTGGTRVVKIKGVLRCY